jgi:hypothetical protein
VSSLDLEFDLDSRVNKLELEWREAFEASLTARARYRALSSQSRIDIDELDQAKECLEQCEARKSRVMDKIDQLERRVIYRGSSC